MELKAFIVAVVNEQVRDWISELSLIKYECYPHPDFIVDVAATKFINGELSELLTLINANTDDNYSMHELLNCQYVHIRLPSA
ncbi:hypothetical protein QUN99_003430 [Vibrio parahaemolyticus]|nr:hypothetical protein [Vibrio parahaemolyticus]